MRSSSLLAPSSSSVYQAHVLRGSNRTSITAPTPVSFQQYIEMMEYQNIQTRMLGADSFPYRSVTITEQVNVVCNSYSAQECMCIVCCH